MSANSMEDSRIARTVQHMDDQILLTTPATVAAVQLRRAKALIHDMDVDTARYLLDGMLRPSTAAAFVKDVEELGDRIKDAGDKKKAPVYGHQKADRKPSNVDGASQGVGYSHADAICFTNNDESNEEPDLFDSKANIMEDSMPSTITDDFVSFLPSTGTHLTTHIINHGGTININYNTCQNPAPPPNSAISSRVGDGLEVDGAAKDDGRESTSTPTRTYPSPTHEPVIVPSTMTGTSSPLTSADHRRWITPSWAISPIEKAKLKDSVDLMFMGDPSRVNLARDMAALAKIIRTDKWDETLQRWTPMVVEYDSSNTRKEHSGSLVSPSTDEFEGMSTHVSLTSIKTQEGPFEYTIFGGDETFQCDRSRVGITVPSKDQSDSSDIGGNPSDTLYTGAVVRWTESTQDIRTGAIKARTDEPPSTDQRRGEGRVFKWPTPGQNKPKAGGPVVLDPAGTTSVPGPKNTRAGQDGKPALESVMKGTRGVPWKPAKGVTFKVAGDREATNEPSQGVSSRAEGPSPKGKQKETYLESQTTESDPDGAPREGQSSMAATMTADLERVLRSRKAKQDPIEAESKDATDGAKHKQHPYAARKAGKPDAKTNTTQAGHTKNKGSKEATQTNAPGQKVDKPRSKKPANNEADTCERDTDAPASSSAGGQAANSAFLGILARLGGGGGTAVVPGAQDEPEPSSLLGRGSGLLKCRLCRKTFSDKTNVRQEDGGAPCSFHPGVLEDKDGKNLSYTFSCCGGPPVMVGLNLVAMNLVSPGCTKCYHQTKRSAWNLETFKMRDPVLFEG